MIVPDWIDENAYRFTKRLTASQWAWEFLRRNPAYRDQWQTFIMTWRELEAAYGKPSQRDIAAWKRDPRAWVPAKECAGSDCKVDGDKVLIECALGARWGFYKFPPDPADDDPVGEGRLTWREVESVPCLVGVDENCHRESVENVQVSFDLALPLVAQLLSAKRQLQIEQRRRIKSGLILSPRITAHGESLRRQLRLLDALEVGAEPEQIRLQLYPDAFTKLAEERRSALGLRDRDYRQLLLLE